MKDGGKVIASGGYGCIFKPALKCKNDDNNYDNGISKLMTTKNTKIEYKEIQKFLKYLKRIPNYEKYFIVPYTICDPQPLSEEDKEYFNNKCKPLVDKNINSNNINRNLQKVKLLQLPYGGINIEKTISEINSVKEIKKLNKKLINLLKHGIITMNSLHIYHSDVKGENILYGDDGELRIIDWGLSYYVKKKNVIHEKAAHRPLHFNLPYTNILLNFDVIAKIHEYYDRCNDNNISITIDSVKDFFIDYYEQDFKYNYGEGHEKFIYNQMDNYFIRGSTSTNGKNELFRYIGKAIYKFTSYVNGKALFDVRKYFYNVYLKNVDVWGFLSIYFSFIFNTYSSPTIKLFQNKLREIILYHLLGSCDKPISLKELSRDLNNLDKILLLTGNNIFDLTVSNVTIPNSIQGTITKSISFDYVTKNRRTKRKIQRLFNNTSKTVKSTKEKINNNTRKRCPNGTRRRKIDGICIPK